MLRFLRTLARIILRTVWRIQGRRTCNVFGYRIRLTPGTEFPAWPLILLPRDSWHAEITRYGDFVQLHAMCRYVSEIDHPPVIVDVGAHHGVYAVILGAMVQKKGGVVIAVEPDPSNYRVLKENVRLNSLNDTVRCEQVAILDRHASLTFEPNGSRSHVSLAANRAGIIVTTITLADLLARYHLEGVDLLQIDVEGAELPVLQGFPWASARVKDIFCELHPYAWASFGYGAQEWIEFLRRHRLGCVDTYLKVHREFYGNHYIGPTRLLPLNGYATASRES